MSQVKIYISNKFKEVLCAIAHNSSIAEKLLMSHQDSDELIDGHINYLSIAEDDLSKMSYLTPDRMLKINETDQDFWNSSKRYQSKFGSAINKLYKNIDNKELEAFANALKAYSSIDNLNFKVIEGNEIKKYYHHNSYVNSSKGTLHASCMKHDQCQSFFDIYVQNPKHIKMLVLLDKDGYLLGRALLWYVDGGVQIMDRIYTVQEEDVFNFKNWAIKNNFLYREKQNWANPFQFETATNKRVEFKLSFKIPNFAFKYYPYMDTFKWLNVDTGEAYNYKPSTNITGVRTLTNANGATDRFSHCEWDGINNQYHYRDDMDSITYYPENPEIWTNRSSIVWSELNNCNIYVNDSKHHENSDSFIFNEKYEKLNDNEKISKYDEYFTHFKNHREKYRIGLSDVRYVVRDIILNGASFDKYVSDFQANSSKKEVTKKENVGKKGVMYGRYAISDYIFDQPILADVADEANDSDEANEATHGAGDVIAVGERFTVTRTEPIASGSNDVEAPYGRIYRPIASGSIGTRPQRPPTRILPRNGSETSNTEEVGYDDVREVDNPSAIEDILPVSTIEPTNPTYTSISEELEEIRASIISASSSEFRRTTSPSRISELYQSYIRTINSRI